MVIRSDICTAIGYGGEAVAPTAIVFRSRLWEAGPKISITIGRSLAVLECVARRSEKSEPPLDVWAVVPHVDDTFQRLVIPKMCRTSRSKESLKKRLAA